MQSPECSVTKKLLNNFNLKYSMTQKELVPRPPSPEQFTSPVYSVNEKIPKKFLPPI